MTAILERRESASLWARFCEWITSTENRSAGMNLKEVR
jgi:photosystem II P680 reaction center D1 protein